MIHLHIFLQVLEIKSFYIFQTIKKVREVRKLTRKEVALVSLDAHETNGASNWLSMECEAQKRRKVRALSHIARIPSDEEAVFQAAEKKSLATVLQLPCRFLSLGRIRAPNFADVYKSFRLVYKLIGQPELMFV